MADIAAGVHVHAHNTRTNLSDLDQYRYQPDFQDLPAQAAQPADREVQIYRRANGDKPACVMSCGSCQPWAVSTASRGRSRTVF
ncbi:hypothetical protein MJK70_23525 [Klebsiella pneumoniae]|nr:hypothetical protein MJK70_23525 [Klebsiella pneumoniae]